MLITQGIDDLLGGVSQALQRLRDSSQAEDQVNLLSHLVKGLRKRPPSMHVAKLTSDATGYDSAFDLPINRSAAERYRAVIVAGDLKVYDALTGAAITVLFPDGKAYLAGSGKDFRAVITGDTAVIVNRTIMGAKNVSVKAPDATPQALVAVKLGDYSTAYTITLDGVVVTYQTPATTGTNAKQAIGTDVIAESLRVALFANGFGTPYTLTRYGSALHLIRNDGKDFTLTVSDGLGGTGLKAIKGSVQLATDLPPVAKAGMVVEVVGSPESQADNYFVQYDDSDTPGQAGVWKEVVEPGTLTDVLPSTMPHVLVFDGAIIDGEPQHGPVAIPIISQGGSSQQWIQGWQFKNSLAISENGEYTTRLNGDAFLTTLTATDSTVRTITVGYDVDTSSLSPTDFVTVEVFLETGALTGVFNSVGSTIYSTPNTYPDETIQFTASPVSGARVKLVFTYGSGGTPSLPNVAYITVHGSGSALPGILMQKGLGSTLTFDPAEKYPAGTSVTITLDGVHNFVYNIGATDQTGTQVATGLTALIDPDATYGATNPSAGVVLVTQGSGAPPVVAFASSFNASNTFWNPDLALIASAHIGDVIRNLTDSSVGTITANTGTTITATLTGGADNAFQAGDLCELVGAGSYFVFKEATWKSRVVGNDISNPFPEFVEGTIDDVFFYENRLGFTVGENVYLSCSGDPFNFFRTTVTDLLASDVIAVKPPGRKVRRFDNAVPWADGVYLFTEAGEFFRVSGNPVMGPSTVRIDVMGKYPVSRDVRPIVAGTRLLLASVRNGATRLAFAERVLSVSSIASISVKDITKHVPAYLLGNPVALAVDDEAQVILVLTDGAPRSLYVCFYALSSDESLAQLAWSRWDFAADSNVAAMDTLSGVVGLIFKRPDGAYLESLVMDPEETISQYYLIGDGTALGDGTWGGDGTLI